jgi:hypothetical protein
VLPSSKPAGFILRFPRQLSSLVFATGLTTFTAAGTSHAGDEVKILVLKEHGVGSAATAQGFVDKLVQSVATQQDWVAASGKYHTTRASAKPWIAANHPHFGIISLAAFLALEKPEKLDIIGKAEIQGGGGGKYFVVSVTHKTLDACKGKTLATDHGDDTRFIDKVVSGSDFDLADFKVVATTRPVQTIKAVTRGEAECALIDDAQLASAKNLEGGNTLSTVWDSQALPPMVVVAFPSAPAPAKQKFKTGLAAVCTGPGKSACAEVGIKKLTPSNGSEYTSVKAAY